MNNNLDEKNNKDLFSILKRMLLDGKFDIPSHRMMSPKWLIKHLGERNINNELYNSVIEIVDILYKRGV